MNTVFLNGEYMAIEDAKISPLDRGFLFGDGIYEVIPSYSGKTVGFQGHINRMKCGFKAIGLKLDWSDDQWRALCDTLAEKNEGEEFGIYIHISRGADIKRAHGFPENISPTIFAMVFNVPEPKAPCISSVKSIGLTSMEDLRWKRCHIKSTSLLGNVLHYQESCDAGSQEALLYNDNQELTEAAAANIFIVKDGVIATPPKSHQILAGITRGLVIEILKMEGTLIVEERVISMDEVKNADEIWVTSSTKEIIPVTQLDGKPVGTGEVGSVWLATARLYFNNKFNY